MRRSLVLAVIALLHAPTGAAAEIVPQRGMAGVRLGMLPAQVRAVLGTPDVDRTRPHPVTRTVRRWYFRSRKVHVAFNGGRVSAVFTRRGLERTSTGLGVGARRRDVRAKLSGEACEGRICHLGDLLPGRTVTTFRLSRRGIVTEVLVGYVID